MLLDVDELPHAVSIYSPSNSVDGGGGTNTVWTTLVAANVPCQIMFGEGGERNEYDQSQFERNTNTIAFNESAEPLIARGYRFTDERTSEKYRVTGVSRKQGIGGIPDYLIVQVTQVVD